MHSTNLNVVIMILRLYAMFERRKSILIFTLSSLAMVLVSEGVLISFAIRTTLREHQLIL